MKLFKPLLITLLILVNFLLVSPALADKPKFLKNPDYIEVTKNLNEFLREKEAQVQAEGTTSETLQQKIDQLEFQKYALETGINWGQCSNQTGRTLAVYGPTPDFDDDDFDYPYNNALYFLADGQATKPKWDCDGVYLPKDAKTTVINPDGQSQEVSGPIVVSTADGTQLVVKTNPDTGVIVFNNPPTKVLKAGEQKWFIPNVAQAAIDTRLPNAPGIKIADATNLVGKKNTAPAAVPSHAPPQAQPQTEPEPQTQVESQPQPQSEPTSRKTGSYRRNRF